MRRPVGLVSAACVTLTTVAIQAQTSQFVAIRLDSLYLRDPHVYIDYLGCRDVTDTAFLGFSMNGELAMNIATDGDGDGYLDLSLLLVPRSAAGLQACGNLTFASAQCTAPAETTQCKTYNDISMVVYSEAFEGVCLDVLPDTTRPYNPAVSHPSDPCLVGEPMPVTLDFGGIPLSLSDAQVGATYADDSPVRLVNGLLRGFLSEADANNTIIAASFPLVGGKPFSVMLPGGDPPGPDRNCASHDDRDTGPDGVTPGWWFYFNFTAHPVPLSCNSPADVTLDCRVGLFDWQTLAACWSDLAGGESECLCRPFDRDGDARLYLHELAVFQNCFSGGQPLPDPACGRGP